MSILGFLFGTARNQAPGTPRAGELEETLAEYRRRARREPRQAADWQRRIAETLIQAERRDEAVEAYLKAAEIYEKDDLNLKAMAIYKAVLRWIRKTRWCAASWASWPAPKSRQPQTRRATPVP
ncbi:MAG: hypothetical protein Q9Q13_03360 [Acidobacteriota bacterium]|nr:hypothetical protein [Acidobacteriota bacterium]